MLIARWHINARFGESRSALALMRRWWQEIAPQIGWSTDQVQIATASVGVEESCIEVQVTLRDLSELHSAWSRLAETPDQQRWAEELAPFVVSGSSRWTVFRVLPS